MLHIVLHFVVPLIFVLTVVFISNRRGWSNSGFSTSFADWRVAWLWLMGGMVIDLDHLLADPIYDAARCSIGFHPLHSMPAMIFYAVAFLLTFYRPAASVRIPEQYVERARLVLIGIALHLILDATDCVF